jgi:bacteriorhodopsin
VKPLAYIVVTVLSAGVAIGLATGNVNLTEASFLKLLWFVCGFVVSGIVYYASWEERTDYGKHVRERKHNECLALAAIPFVIFTVLYIIVRAANISNL